MNTWKVIRFNWPKYLAAITLLAVAVAVTRTHAPLWIRYLLWAACLPGCAWTLTSLAATWWAYDHAKVYEHLADGLPGSGTWAAVHAGFDDSLPVLRELLARPPAAIAEIALTPGPSLRRARNLEKQKSGSNALSAERPKPPPTRPHLLPAGSLDTVFVTFAVHEVRDRAGQRELFTALRRSLRPGGRVVLTEHSRDTPNFAVYGPGALHFQPLRTWHTRAAEAGLTRESLLRITPFIRRVVYRRR
jgi:SAM-dependent methyltransferase